MEEVSYLTVCYFILKVIPTPGGWVHDVSFSPSGDKLAWVGHDSSISVVNMGAGADW